MNKQMFLIFELTRLLDSLLILKINWELVTHDSINGVTQLTYPCGDPWRKSNLFLLSNFLDKLNNVFMLNIRHLRLWWDEESL